MAREVRNFAVTIPAATLTTAPYVEDLTMPARQVIEVRVRVPPGPSGLVGWALGSAGERVLPWGEGQWIVADDEAISWPLEGQIESGAWQLQGYNLGVYDHTVYVTFLLDTPGTRATSMGLAPLEIGG
jgi:hypothetical protein